MPERLLASSKPLLWPCPFGVHKATARVWAQQVQPPAILEACGDLREGPRRPRRDEVDLLRRPRRESTIFSTSPWQSGASRNPIPRRPRAHASASFSTQLTSKEGTGSCGRQGG